MKYYISTETEQDKSFYGVLELVDNKPFQTLSGSISSENPADETVKIVLRKLEKQSILKIRKNLYFKFDDISTSKEMLYQFYHDKFYLDYANRNNVNFFSSPSVFLTDLENNNIAKRALNRYKLIEQYFNNRHKGR